MEEQVDYKSSVMATEVIKWIDPNLELPTDTQREYLVKEKGAGVKLCSWHGDHFEFWAWVIEAEMWAELPKGKCD